VVECQRGIAINERGREGERKGGREGGREGGRDGGRKEERKEGIFLLQRTTFLSVYLSFSIAK
jgi:hypothetical protein